ncbi:MAG: methyltransferase [Polyangiales bacterium]
MKISDKAAAVLSTCVVDGNAVRITSGQLERKLYLEVNAVLEAIGGKWDRKTKIHLFVAPPSDALEASIESGEVRTIREDRASMGYFPTPARLAAELVKMAGIEPGMAVLEPSAGEGAIASAIAAAHGIPTCVELDPGRAKKLVDVGFSQVHCGDFLDYRPTNTFDRIVMNPPFSVTGNRRADIAHVRHAVDLLARGGRLVSVMSAGVEFRDDALTRAFRDQFGATITRLPEDAFKASGTAVRTVTVTIDKR